MSKKDKEIFDSYASGNPNQRFDSDTIFSQGFKARLSFELYYEYIKKNKAS